MTRYQVFAFELLCCKALFPPAAFNMEEALCSVEEDLQRDLGDRENMSFHEFFMSLFEICDMWTLTCEKDEYIVFFRNLYLRISEPSVTGSRQFRRIEAITSVEIKMFRIRSPWSNSERIFGERDLVPETSGDLGSRDEHSERAEKTSF